MFSLLSTNQSTKVEKSQFRCSSIVFTSSFWKTREVSSAYNSILAYYWHKLKSAVDPKLIDWSLWHTTCYWYFIWIGIFYIDNKRSIWKMWCGPLDCLVMMVKLFKRHFLIKMLWPIVSNTFCKSIILTLTFNIYFLKKKLEYNTVTCIEKCIYACWILYTYIHKQKIYLRWKINLNNN